MQKHTFQANHLAKRSLTIHLLKITETSADSKTIRLQIWRKAKDPAAFEHKQYLIWLAVSVIADSLFLFLIKCICLSFSIEKIPLDKALNLSLYLSKESEIMPVTQGFNELVPLYKLMEKRNMEELENQLKVVVADTIKSSLKMICAIVWMLSYFLVSQFRECI